MTDILSIAGTAGLWLGFAFAAWCLIVAAKHRKKWMPPLEELVTLDSRGWYLIATLASVGAFVMIATSQLFSSSYWVGLAINADGAKMPAHLFPFGWLALVSIGTVAAFALSVIFELVADIGAPAASGLKKEKKKGTPELLLIVTGLCIVMSLASKWGFYEDKRNHRAEEAARVKVTDSAATAALAEANETIERLKASPSVEIAAATEDAIKKQIADLEAERTEARQARDALPENQGSNRLKYQQTIDAHTKSLGELEEKKIEAQRIREDAKTLADAKAAKIAAEAAIKADAGKLTEDKKEIVRIGDTVLIRLLRAGLHQALCFLFPIIALDAWSTHRAVLKREDAAKRAADTRRRNNPNSVFEGEFEPAAEGEPVKPFGGYLQTEKPAEGEAPAPDITDAETFEGEEGEGDAGEPGEGDAGEPGEDDHSGEGPEDAKS